VAQYRLFGTTNMLRQDRSAHSKNSLSGFCNNLAIVSRWRLFAPHFGQLEIALIFKMALRAWAGAQKCLSGGGKAEWF